MSFRRTQNASDHASGTGGAPFGPAGVSGQDDGEKWERCSQASAGLIAGRNVFNYQMGLGHEGTHPELKGSVSRGESEQNQRAFYRHWAERMGDSA